MKRPRPTPIRSASTPWRDVVAVLLCVGFALWVQRRALGAFFSLDDLVILEEVRGLRATVPGPWRLLSRHLYFGAAVPAFGSDPFPYHLVSWLLHGVNVTLLYALVRARACTAAAAALAAGLFGATRLHVSALGSAATVGEPLALGLALGSLLVVDRGRSGRIGAPLLFLGALLSKESVVLLPAVLLLPGLGAGPFRERARRAAPMLALGAAFAIALLATGAGETRLGGPAYARAYGANLVSNLMTYTRWVVAIGDPFPGMVSAIDPRAWPVGAAATAVLAAVAIVARSAAPSPLLGAAWWLLALLPVLPLLHHSYLYYLYIPVAGLAIVCAGALGWVERHAPRARTTAAVVTGGTFLLVLAHGLHADRLLAARYAARLPGTGVPLDPELRKSEIARHASATVGATLGGRPGRVAFLLPAGLSETYSTATGARQDSASGPAAYSMLAGSIDDGRGLRALHANLDSVAIISGWASGYLDFDLFAQGRSGSVFPLGRGADGFARAAELMIGGHTLEPARALLEGALGESPDHAPLRYQYARCLYFSGDSLGMQRELDELLRRAPAHPLAARVRAGLPAAGGR